MNPPKPKDKFFTRISVSSGKLGTSSGFGVRLRASGFRLQERYAI
jgi:hypothetical protein